MKRRPGWLFWGALALCLVLGLERILADPDQPTSRGSVVISEFAAANGAGILDDDQERSDWIELYNRSAQPVDLAGWALTDDPTQTDKWTFRSFSLAPGQVILCFSPRKKPRGDRAGERASLSAPQLPAVQRRRFSGALPADLAPIPRRLGL